MENKKFRLKIKKKTLLIIDWANVWGWSKTLKWEVCPKKLFKFFDRPKIIGRRLYHGVEVGQQKSEEFKVEIENIGFISVSKEVKWPPVFLEKQQHFKKIVKDLFDVLDNVKKTNSELSIKLYDLAQKINSLLDDLASLEKEGSLKNIFSSIEDLDNELKKLNIDIGGLQENLKLPVRRRKCDFDVEITRDALNLVNDYETLLLFSGDGDYAALTKDLIQKGKKVILVFAPGHMGKEYLEIENDLFYACSIVNLRNILQK
ncbi:MAG: NYN domain-containing protein [Patescibacteria group bacterium]|jgi:uncharacterized LabA/DUF88 family protein